MLNVFEEDTTFGNGVGFIQLEAQIRAVGDPVCPVPESDDDLVLWRYISFHYSIVFTLTYVDSCSELISEWIQ